MMNCDAEKASDDALGCDAVITLVTGYVTEGPIRVIEKSVLGGSLFAHDPAWRSLILSQLYASKIFIFDY